MYYYTAFVALLSAQFVNALPHSQWKAVFDSDVVRAAVAFHQPKLAEAEALLMDISDPTSSKFGQYLDRKDIQAFFEPSENSQNRVLRWLEDAGIDMSSVHLKKAAAVMEFTASVKKLGKMLGGGVEVMRNDVTGELRLEPSGHEVPSAIEDDVEFIALTPPPKAGKTKRSRSVKPVLDTIPPPYKLPVADDLRNCSESWTPACIRKLYGIPLGTKAAKNNSMGLYGYGDPYDQADLNMFWSKHAPFIPKGTTPKVNSINGAKAIGDPVEGEELLDIEMSYPIVYPQTVTMFQTDYNNKGGLLNDFLDAVDASYCKYDGGDDPDFDPVFPIFGGYQGPAMCGKYKVTNVVSISFAVDEQSLPRHYIQRQCHEWMKLALSGVTVVVAAGDRGVQGATQCTVNPYDKTKSAFNSLFPGNCPYVTAVGATQVNFTGSKTHEVAVYDPKHNFYSGGGFSNILAQPAYQKKAVASYLAANNPHYPKGTYNISGRAFPDVALLGANVTFVQDGKTTISGGTSAATPMFGAMINRINDERILAGKKPIGFLNQILYQHPEVFTDITEGSNPGCDTQGFKAAKGWDPVSGMGSPQFPKLRDLLVSLP
ncbi:tripeptidyl-peptidase I precursor [Fusarium beomiforme]|uniref:Tripeptidyl-peptidase I n=1 Tax=Fusarium beomiforme TaxID=44412 RepID=A0A9P5ABG3_9HYPO|nr:tripeptidyl-peptidase I precursor [Fusarium beomiforme]